MLQKPIDLTAHLRQKLGECVALCGQLAQTPIPPKIADVALQSIHCKTTTGQLVTPQPYTQPRIDAIVALQNKILDSVEHNGVLPVTTDDLCAYNVGLLGHLTAVESFQHIRFRQRSMSVHGYQAPHWRQCEHLVSELLIWLNQPLTDEQQVDALGFGITRALWAHLNLVLIHPFSDGNGRTARMLEFRLLLECGVSAIAAHLPTNLVNVDRQAYYDSLDCVAKGGSHEPFFDFALSGFRVLMGQLCRMSMGAHLREAWLAHLISQPDILSRGFSRRRLELALEVDKLDQPMSPEDMFASCAKIKKLYAQGGRPALEKDIGQLIGEGHLQQTAKGISANHALGFAFLPRGRKGLFEENLAKGIDGLSQLNL